MPKIQITTGGDEFRSDELYLLREEAIDLIKYWSLEVLELSWLMNMDGQYSRSSGLRLEYADRRVRELGELVSEEEAKKATQEVRDKFRESVGQKYWEIFTGEWREEYEREFHPRQENP